MKGAPGMQAGVCFFCLLLALQPFLAGETNDRHQSALQEPSEKSTALLAPLPYFLCAPTHNLRCTQLLKALNPPEKEV